MANKSVNKALPGFDKTRGLWTELGASLLTLTVMMTLSSTPGDSVQKVQWSLLSWSPDTHHAGPSRYPTVLPWVGITITLFP